MLEINIDFLETGKAALATLNHSIDTEDPDYHSGGGCDCAKHRKRNDLARAVQNAEELEQSIERMVERANENLTTALKDWKTVLKK